MNKGKKRHSRSNPHRLALTSLAGLPVPVWREATSRRRDKQDLNTSACQRVMPRSYSLTGQLSSMISAHFQTLNSWMRQKWSLCVQKRERIRFHYPMTSLNASSCSLHYHGLWDQAAHNFPISETMILSSQLCHSLPDRATVHSKLMRNSSNT